MFCTTCGQPLEPRDRFCTHCGTPAANVAATASAPAQPAPEPVRDVPQPAPARILRSTADVVFPSSVSGTSSFRMAPVTPVRASSGAVEVPQDVLHTASAAEGVGTSDAAPTRVSSVFSYRARPNIATEPQTEAAAATPARSPVAPQSVSPLAGTDAPPQTRQCATCGRRNSADGTFCEACGARLDAQPAIAMARQEYAAVAPASVAPLFHDTIPPQAPPPRADLSPLPAASVGPVARNAVPTVYDNLPYATDLPPRAKSGKALWIAAVIVLLAALAFVGWMLHPASRSAASGAAGSNVDIRLTPALSRVAAGNGLDLTATVSGSQVPEVTWTVQEGAAGGHVVSRGALAKDGQVSMQAVYVAPEEPGTYHVVVASKADPSKSAVAEVTVTAAEPTQR